MSESESKSFYNLQAFDYQDNTINFDTFKGNVLLITNMASIDGYAKSNLSTLADIQTLYGDYGLKVLIFPCLQFAKDNVGLLKKMHDTITYYSEKFIIFSDVKISGKHIHPVFKHLIKYSKGFCGKFLKWNFAKFIIDDKGRIVKKFEPSDRLEVDDKIFKRLLKGKEPVKQEAEVVKYESDPYNTNFDSEEEEYY